MSGLSRLLLCLCLLAGARSAPLYAAAEPHGKRYLAAADAPVPVAGAAFTPEPPLAPADLRRRVTQLREQAREQEFGAGPYAARLGETLADLARALDSVGDAEGALEARERALHLIRINDGLYSARQGPVLRDLLNSFREREDYVALDERYSYFFRLFGAARAPYTELRWRAAMEYFNWQREALLLNVDGDPRRRLVELHTLQDDRRQALLERAGEEWVALREISLSQLATLYLIEEEIDIPELLYDPRTQRRRREDPLDFDPMQERVENLKNSSRSRGRSLLEEALEANPGAAPRERAELQLALADWLQWHGSTRSAREVYEDAWKTLTEAGLTQLREEYFEQPVPLPAAPVFFIADSPLGPPLSCRLDVSISGRARVRDCSGTGDGGSLTLLRRLLQASRFRPVFRDGQPLAVDDIETRWRLRED
ncbi:MAG: hypothetical protein V2I82_02690 [Halieaceae bacterium]|nr:hypothetical protein [Halieaceae bacterium]